VEVILSANITHYYYAALALQQAHILKRYICAIGVRGGDPWFARLLPDYWKKKLHGRDISGVSPELARTIWMPEILQRGLPYLGLISRDRGNWLNNYLYDFLAGRWVEPCDVFHFVNGVGLYSARKAKRHGSIVVCDVRTEYPDFQFRILAEEYERLGLRYDPPGLPYDKKVKAEYVVADYLIVPSRYVQRTFIEAGFDPDRVCVLPYGVDVALFFALSESERGALPAPPPDTQHHPFRIVYAGQIIPRKGVHYLLEAFSRLPMDDIELLLVGHLDRTMAPAVRAAAAQDSRIRIIGEVPKVELRRLYGTGAVLVLPSLADAYALVVLEAMACCLPVIVTENTGSSELVREGVNGFVIPIRSAAAIEERLIYLYEHRSSQRQMGQAARATVRNYTWQCYGQRLLQFYGEILGVNLCQQSGLLAPS
jgi:glycosyltransferase involved in cell wall biosynthesis